MAKEMLFENQLNDPKYRMLKEMQEKQVSLEEIYVPDFLFEEYRAPKLHEKMK